MSARLSTCASGFFAARKRRATQQNSFTLEKTMLKTFTGLVSAAFILATPALAEEATHRQLGPHVHGQGTLDIAIEGKKIEMELVAPGHGHRRLRAHAVDGRAEGLDRERQGKAHRRAHRLQAAGGRAVQGRYGQRRKPQGSRTSRARRTPTRRTRKSRATSIPNSTPLTRSSAKRRKVSPVSRRSTSRTSPARSF